MEISIALNKEKVEALLKRLDKSLQPELLKAGAQGLHNHLIDHFKARQSRPNKSGFPHRGFWYSNNGDSVAERTQEPQISGDKATITIRSAALGRKLSPSPKPIKPGAGKKYLAIPATANAYTFSGMPRSFPGIRFTFAHFPGDPADHKRPALITGKGTSSVVQYWLARKTNPKSDPNALPGSNSMNDAVVKSMESAVKVLLRTPTP